jgi:regulatory protein
MVDKRITAITVQKRNPDRVNIYLDGEYGLSLSRLVAAWLEPGKVLNQQQIDELVEGDTKEKVLQSALKLVDFRSRTERELKDKLSKKGFDQEKIEGVLVKLRESRIVQDDRFAESWVENRNNFHPRSQRLIKYELKNKGITEEVIEEALKNSADDEALAYNAAIKMRNRYSGFDWQVFQKKISAYLLRKGFSYDVVSSTVKKVWQELQNEEN